VTPTNCSISRADVAPFHDSPTPNIIKLLDDYRKSFAAQPIYGIHKLLDRRNLLMICVSGGDTKFAAYSAIANKLEVIAIRSGH